MRVFRTSYRDSKGRTRKASKWYCELRDANETIRRMPAFTSKAASQEFGRTLEKLVGYHKATGGQIDPALSDWLAGLPPRTRDRLVAIGLLDSRRVAVSKPLEGHLEDFGATLAARGCTSKHVALVKGRAKRIIEGCGFRFFGDICGSKVLAYLDGLRADTDKKRGISAQSFNFYLQSIKQFCKWLVKDRRASENPVAHLSGLNVKTDARSRRMSWCCWSARLTMDRSVSG